MWFRRRWICELGHPSKALIVVRNCQTNFLHFTMKRPKYCTPKTEMMHRNRGFALVATLSVVGLIMLLVIGLLGLSSSSLRSASQHYTRAEAQANARLALMLAMGQLQQAAGPDQRVTTTADQWTAPGSDGSSSSAAQERRNWVGVYRAWPSGSAERPSPEFLSWLVSGPTSGANRITSREIVANSPANEILLVDQGTVGSSTSGRVSVPALSLPNARGSSRLAWWTGDQGVKASVDLPARSGDTSVAGVRAGLQTARQMAIQLGGSGTGPRPFAGVVNEDPRRNLVMHWPQASLLADTPASHGALFHDFTACSSGMLTNVRSGGFRKDLSMFLERDAASAPRDPLYYVNNIPGINFAELWLYYNIYKELDLLNYNFTTGGSSGANTPGFQMAPNQAAFQNDNASFYTQPSIVSYKAVFSLTARSVTVNGAPRQRLGIVVDPIITFWNPLDVPVSVSPAYLSIKYWQFPYNITLQVGSRTITSSVRRLLGDEHYLTLIAGRTQPIVIKPGEVLVYSQAAKTQPVYDTPGLNFLQGTAGWNFGGGMAIDIRDTSNAFVDALPTDTVRYSLQPNNETATGSQHWYLVGFGAFYKEDRASRGESVGIGANSVDSRSGNPYFGSVKPNNLRLRASGFPGVFPSFSTTATRPLLVSQLSGRKEPIVMYAHNAKTELSSDRGGRWLSRFNPQPLSFDFSTLSDAERDLHPYEVQVDLLDSWRNRNLEVTPTGTGYYGGGWTADVGTGYLVTHTVPRGPVHSLAAFQHAFANGGRAGGGSVSDDDGGTTTGTTGRALVNINQSMLPYISHPIGNSLAPSVIAPNRTDGTLDGGRTLGDHSYLANQALWDDWFLSGIAPDRLTSRTQRQVGSDFLKGISKLPTSRYRPAIAAAEADALLARLFSGTQASATAHLLTAPAIRVDGLFNINSTSVEAWKAIFGALRGHPIITRSLEGVESVTNSGGTETPVANLISARNLAARGSGNVPVTDAAQFVGRRALNDAEIDGLARALVREIRRRGPFLSLADFINRRPGTDREFAKAGPLQAALDSQGAAINTAYNSGARAVPDSVAGRYPFREAEAGAAAYGVPGIVKQADILTPIAPILSARSDTFIIRTYGESVAGGKVVAKAWCEAVVRRRPEFIDSRDAPDTIAAGLQSEINRRYGRGFEVVSFRWLNPEEI